MPDPAWNMYETLVKRIHDLEVEQEENKGASLPPSDKTRLRQAYAELLEAYPALEGFWVRWAHTEFHIADSAAALDIFERALAVPILRYSVIIWVSYLRFLTHVYHPTPQPPEHVRELFRLASELIGNHFLSHEFWDLYLEWSPEPIQILLHILDDLTIHQFAKFYARLAELVEADSTDLRQFGEVAPPEASLATEDEARQLRSVMMSKLKLKYELQLRRVNEVLPFERAIHRPFFHPKNVPVSEIEAWVRYLNAFPSHILYRRALIPNALNGRMWLAYIRFEFRNDTSKSDMKETYNEALAFSRSNAVSLHFSLWLEMQRELEEARAVYEVAPEDRLQFSRFLARQKEEHAARDVLLSLVKDRPNVTALAELAKYDRDAFDNNDLSAQSGFWKAKLAVFPEQADKIFREAPKDAITDEYLAFLSRTNASKYLAVDSDIHRSAL